MIVIVIFLVLLTKILRGRIREKLRIPGTLREDYRVALLCTSCSIAQMARTVHNYQDGDSVKRGADSEPAW
jgi:Cys-rich protein (TIGR01571 family)